MQRNFFGQAALMLMTILLTLHVISPWLLTPTPSHGARPTEYKVIPLPEIPRGALKGDVMNTPTSQLMREKVKAAAEVLQQTLNEYAKNGWELHTVDQLNGVLVFKK
jgi:hypothetical protein